MRLTAIAALSFVFAPPALAQDGTVVHPKVQAMFPLGEEVCYSASFKRQDMKAGQKLTAIQMYRLFDPNPLKEAVEFTREEAIAFDRSGTNGNWADIAARFSDKPFLYSQTLNCSYSEESGRVFCGVECDGGSFVATLKGQDIEAHFSKDSGGGLALNESCGDPDDSGNGRWMTPTEAGGSFTFKKVKTEECRAVGAQVKPAFVKDLAPLRQRIATLGWRCLNRSYDKAHLAKHPKQKVTNISVAIGGPARADQPSLDEYSSTLLDVTLSFRLRNGDVKSRAVQCRAFEYEFSCDGGFRLRRRDGASALLVAGEYTEAGKAPTMLDTKLGGDDALFRLDAETHDDCSIE